jgi:hypothetical protein
MALQCEDQTYDIEAYLAVLKLYQFNPGQVKLDIETVRCVHLLPSRALSLALSLPLCTLYWIL